jgi:hypothetical protein
MVVNSLNELAEWVTRATTIPDHRVRVSKTDCPLVSPRQAVVYKALRRLNFTIAEYNPDGFMLLENPDLSSSNCGRRLVLPFGGNATHKNPPAVGKIVNYGGLGSTQAVCVYVYRLKELGNGPDFYPAADRQSSRTV